MNERESVKQLITIENKRLTAKLKNLGLWDWVLASVPEEQKVIITKDTELIYLALHPEVFPQCKYGNPRYFYSLQKGYAERCRVNTCKCHSDWRESPDWKIRANTAKQKRKETFLKRYGVSNPSQHSVVQDRKIKINQERYGCNWATSSDIIKQRIKDTNQERYGCDSVLQLPEIRKSLQNYRDKHIEEIITKTQSTNLEKYGTVCAAQSDIVREKIKATNISRYGVEWTTQSEIMKQKSRETCLARYGVDYAWESEEVRQNFSEKHKEETGMEWPSQRGFSDELWLLLNNADELQAEINALGTLGIATKYNTTRGTIYRHAAKYNLTFPEINSYEAEIEGWLIEQKINFIRNDRIQLKPKELDFYIPEYKIGIEFQGTYWHMDPKFFAETDYNSSTHKTAQQHWESDIHKLNECLDKGIELIVIWENDWNSNKEQIKQSILKTINELQG